MTHGDKRDANDSLALQSFRIRGGDSIKCMSAADPRSDIRGREMMIGHVRKEGRR